MRAATHPGVGRLELAHRPDPAPGEGQVVVRVRASGLNRADLLQRAGRYPAPPGWPADIPGLEYAGEVVACGTGASRFAPGDRVMGLVGGGAHAEMLVIDELEALAIPDGMPFTDAAAIPEAFLTAWDALVRARTAPSERVLVHAVGSGVGTAAVQLCGVIGAEAIGTSRTADKLERAAAFGMSRGVSTATEEWPGNVGEPVDVILDVLGGGAFAANIGLLARRGRLVVLGTLTGARADTLDLSHLLRHRIEIIGTSMRTRGLTERVELAARFGADVLPLFGTGVLRPVVDRVVDAAEIERAYEALGSNQTFGKVVISWP